jgi:DNA-binding CsgD family transcriptional regulator/PAS domain-containing protein
MMRSSQAAENRQISELIGAIHDCALQPEGWEPALGAICDLLECANCAVFALDAAAGILTVRLTVRMDPVWAERKAAHAQEAAALYAQSPRLSAVPPDEPYAMRMELPESDVLASRYNQEWAEPQDLVDAIGVRLSATDARIEQFALGRCAGAGLAGARELGLLGLLAPHVRRALAITDALEIAREEARDLETLVNAMSSPVVMTAGDGLILHANDMARRMFSAGRPLRASRGRLISADPAVSARLSAPLAAATRRGGVSSCSLGEAGGVPAAARVIGIDGRAAVIIATGAPAIPWTRPMAELFALTPAEMRVLDRLALGESAAETARALGIAPTTVKTHVSRLLSKTGTRQRAELVALTHRLCPPATSFGAIDPPAPVSP